MERTDRQTDTHTHRRAIMFQGARLGPDGRQTRAKGRSAVGPRWAVALPVGKGADRIAKYKHVQYIYTCTTQLAERMSPRSRSRDRASRLTRWWAGLCVMIRAGKSRDCIETIQSCRLVTRARTIKISKRPRSTDRTGPDEK